MSEKPVWAYWPVDLYWHVVLDVGQDSALVTTRCGQVVRSDATRYGQPYGLRCPSCALRTRLDGDPEDWGEVLLRLYRRGHQDHVPAADRSAVDAVTPVNPSAVVADPTDDERPGCEATDDAVAHLGADHGGGRTASCFQCLGSAVR